MLIKAKTLQGYKLKALDGEIGKVKEFYFDDKHWTIRYLVADTGNWLPGRMVLISPYALVGAVKEDHDIAVSLTRDQIEKSPSLESHKPVSRQFEDVYYGYYGWPAYSDGPFMWGPSPYIVREPRARTQHDSRKKGWDPHLRSTREVSGYHIHASDGEIGHVEDFVVDDETWAIRYLIVSTANWWPGNNVLISPQWIGKVSWEESEVYIDLSRESIRESPEYTEDFLLTRDYETGLHKHYKRKGYWVHEPAPMENAR
jgi:sporulation protein YlmC with PRC-barrel domain